MSNPTQHILEDTTNSMRFLCAYTPTKDIVRIEGSVLGGTNMLPKPKKAAAILVAELLDAGTTTKSKDAIRESLANLGASIAFSAGGDRMHFSAECLPEDLSFVLATIRECLEKSSFPEKEIKTAKERIVGSLKEAKTDTRTQAAIALSRVLYESTHANYATTLDEDIKSILACTRKDLLALRELFGRQELVVAIVGNLAPKTSLMQAKTVFSKLPKGIGVVPAKKASNKAASAEEKKVSIKDKANIDVYLGARLGFSYDDARYVPFLILLSLLGGRGLASGHLMRTVRERDGLTYGIYAMLSGFEDGSDGAWRIWATFAPAVFEKGISTVRAESKVFLKSGVHETALAAKKDEFVGNYLIALSTARGLACKLHQIAREGKALSYIEEYPRILRAVSLADIQSAAKLLDLSKVSISASGTFAKS